MESINNAFISECIVLAIKSPLHSESKYYF